MADECDPIEYHEQVDDEITFVIADPEQEDAWIAVPEADSCPLEYCR